MTDLTCIRSRERHGLFHVLFLPLQSVKFVLASTQSWVYNPSPDSVPAAILASYLVLGIRPSMTYASLSA